MKTWLKRIGLGVLAVLVLALALIGLQTLTRGTPVRSVISLGDGSGPPAVTDSLFVRTMELYTGVHFEPGNRVDILQNGDGTYPQLWRDLASARQTITVQLYYAQPGLVADSLAKYLVDRARNKVRVLLVLDAFGAGPLVDDKEWIAGLEQAGVEIALLRPTHWYNLHKANNRSHVRAIVVDGRVGYTGGFGLADYWLGDGRSTGEWRETNVRVEGPIAAWMQSMFAAAWAEAKGELITGDRYFPSATFRPDDGTVAGAVLFATPTTGSTNAERFMALSIASARRTLYVANAYFVPDDDFRGLLTRAAKRGVDVRILTAGDSTDVKTTTYAGRARYDELLAAGVRIYEYQPSMMHAKTMIVDGMWGTIGSMNFDNRSFAFNNESNIATLDARVGARMDSMFVADLRFSKEINRAEFAKRSWSTRVLEQGANLLSRML